MLAALQDQDVYCMVDLDDPRTFKIGVSNDVAKRLKSLRAASGRRLALYAVCNPRCTEYDERSSFKDIGKPPLAVQVESDLHCELDKYRVRGEWFAFDSFDEGVRAIGKALDSLDRGEKFYDLLWDYVDGPFDCASGVWFVSEVSLCRAA